MIRKTFLTSREPSYPKVTCSTLFYNCGGQGPPRCIMVLQPALYPQYITQVAPHTQQTQQTKLNTNCTKLYTLNKNMMKLNAQLVKENTMKL